MGGRFESCFLLQPLRASAGWGVCVGGVLMVGVGCGWGSGCKWLRVEAEGLRGEWEGRVAKGVAGHNPGAAPTHPPTPPEPTYYPNPSALTHLLP